MTSRDDKSGEQLPPAAQKAVEEFCRYGRSYEWLYAQFMAAQSSTALAPKHLQDAVRVKRETFRVISPDNPMKMIDVVYAPTAACLEREANQLRAQLTAANLRADARAREACTAEKRTTRSFALSATGSAWKPGDQRVVCAALRDTDNRLVTGARHFDGVMMEQIKRGPGVDAWRGAEQGFIDQHGKFLTREEAHEIATRHGQILRRVGSDGMSLFSENLY